MYLPRVGRIPRRITLARLKVLVKIRYVYVYTRNINTFEFADAKAREFNSDFPDRRRFIYSFVRFISPNFF